MIKKKEEIKGGHPVVGLRLHPSVFTSIRQSYPSNYHDDDDDTDDILVEHIDEDGIISMILSMIMMTLVSVYGNLIGPMQCERSKC